MARYPVIVYGASGYTGMLIIDWLIDRGIPFTAVGRDADRIKNNMSERVVRLESAEYEIVECEHDATALAAAFVGGKVVCNTVGPFVNLGLTGVEAALRAGCHYLDTTGEQSYVMDVREQFGAEFAKANLVCAPSTAYMYTLAELAAELALEVPGVDMLETATICRGPRVGSGVTVGSTASIFELFRHDQLHLWDNELVAHEPGKGYEISTPGFLTPIFALPWGGTSLPAFYQHDPRVRYCNSLVGFYDMQIMRRVCALWQQWEAEYRQLAADQQDAVLAKIVESTTPSMPPRERTAMQRSTDFAIGRGPLISTRATVHSVTPYITTGALQTACAIRLLSDDFAKPGFTSASKAFGHRYLLGFLEQRGLTSASVR
jgi:Family of unknown function (DUF5938)/Saccharopine dehydrogenase NADP binding domain